MSALSSSVPFPHHNTDHRSWPALCCTPHYVLPRSQHGSHRPPVTASSLPRRVDGLVRECSEGKHRCGGTFPDYPPRIFPAASARLESVFGRGVLSFFLFPFSLPFAPSAPSYERVDRICQHNSERTRVRTWLPTTRPAAGRHCLAPVVLGTGLHPAWPELCRSRLASTARHGLELALNCYQPLASLGAIRHVRPAPTTFRPLGYHAALHATWDPLASERRLLMPPSSSGAAFGTMTSSPFYL